MKLCIVKMWEKIFLDYEINEDLGSILVLSKRGVEKLYTCGGRSLFTWGGHIVDEDED